MKTPAQHSAESPSFKLKQSGHSSSRYVSYQPSGHPKISGRPRPRKLLKVVLPLLAIVAIATVFFLNFNKSSNSEVATPTPEPAGPTTTTNQLSLVMVGDALIHETVYKDAAANVQANLSNFTDSSDYDGSGYDFTPMLQYTKSITKSYDLAYYNQETVLGGTALGLSGYPMFNSPTAVGDAFQDSGFNLVSLATNHTLDKGEKGVLNSVNYWSQQDGVVTNGQAASQADRDNLQVHEKNGITYAFLSYTTVTNGLTPSAGKEYLTNIYSDEKASADIAKVKDQADLIIVAMHWGTEYTLTPIAEQERIAQYLSDQGVRLIIGAHPHVIEPVEQIGDTIVAYSLGNYISDQEGVERLTGLMLACDITKTTVTDPAAGTSESTLTIDNLNADLLYTSSNSRHRSFRVYPYAQLDNSILSNYQTYQAKYQNVVTSRGAEVSFGTLKGEN